MSKLLAMMMKKKYTRLEYIESTGTQYIDTLIRANQDTTIKIKGSTTNSGTQVYGGCSTSANLWGIGQQSSGNYLFGQYYTQSGNERILTNYAGNDDVARTLELRKNEFYIDGQLIGSRTAKTFTTTTIKLFTLNPSISKSSIKMYLAQIEDENGNLVFDGVPVIRNSDNEIGMFDRVSGQFFGNAGTGKFRVPNEVGYTVVGNPTIVDGVVSGFDNSNYLQLPQIDIGKAKKFEISTKFTTGASFDTSQLYIISIQLAYSYGIRLEKSGTKATVYGRSRSNGSYYNVNGTVLGILPNSTHWVKYIVDGEKGTTELKTSTDGINWDSFTGEYTIGYYNEYDIQWRVGSIGNANFFNGSIDLNNTSIKLNEKLWFNGQPA